MTQTNNEREANHNYETNIARREASHIHDSDEYFNARPQIDSNDRRRVFEAGFERGWQAARNQSNNVPVARLHDDGCFTIPQGSPLQYEIRHAGWKMDVYSSPPDTANVLEMAADKKAYEIAYNALEDIRKEASVRGFYLDIERMAIKAMEDSWEVKSGNLIPQPESTAPQQAISVDLDALIYEHTRFNVNQAEDAITIKGIRSLINAVLSVAQQPESEGK